MDRSEIHTAGSYIDIPDPVEHTLESFKAIENALGYTLDEVLEASIHRDRESEFEKSTVSFITVMKQKEVFVLNSMY